tara:strand:- start:148 stop:282 length:135 start_codon:yes stop_codon:yes gene_type:complete
MPGLSSTPYNTTNEINGTSKAPHSVDNSIPGSSNTSEETKQDIL